jgi:hypothetical protein
VRTERPERRISRPAEGRTVAGETGHLDANFQLAFLETMAEQHQLTSVVTMQRTPCSQGRYSKRSTMELHEIFETTCGLPRGRRVLPVVIQVGSLHILAKTPPTRPCSTSPSASTAPSHNNLTAATTQN